MPASWYFERVGLALTDLLGEVSTKLGASPDAARVAMEHPQLYLSRLAEIEEIKVVADVARGHAGTVPLAVASSGQPSLIYSTLQAVGLVELFREIVTIADVRNGKPAPDLFLEAARRLQVPPELCVVYEDSAEGLEAARRAGMRAVDIRTVHTPSWSAEGGALHRS